MKYLVFILLSISAHAQSADDAAFVDSDAGWTETKAGLQSMRIHNEAELDKYVKADRCRVKKENVRAASLPEGTEFRYQVAKDKILSWFKQKDGYIGPDKTLHSAPPASRGDYELTDIFSDCKAIVANANGN